MRTLFKDIPLEQMNTSMTINATAAWLLALYIAVAEEQGADAQADRHGAERHHQGIPVARHLCVSAGAVLRLITDVSPSPTWEQVPEVEPDERLLLPPAGSRRDAGAGAGLRAGHGDCRARHGQGARPGAGRGFPEVVGRRISFFVNAGIRFVTEMCKMRAFVDLWDEICESATASRTRSSAASATACRSIRSA
jgi:(2R)-ethylmalonyl-CoA mutase